jgi:hypothetical protein
MRLPNVYLRVTPMPQWQTIDTAPLDVDVSVQAEDYLGRYALRFPCRLTEAGWINSRTGTRLAVLRAGRRTRRQGMQHAPASRHIEGRELPD